MSKYELFINPIRQADGSFKNLYQVGRIIDPTKPLHGGNREIIGNFHTLMEAEKALLEANNEI